jgi:NTP pyrophosphatase (non-canonical NTP hydrolase)
MSSACTCHVNTDTCWWCLYQKEKERADRYEKALKKIDERLMWGNAENAYEECKRIIKETSGGKEMNVNELTTLIEEWANDRGLHVADPTKQTLKLGEEFGELCQGMAKNKPDQVIDSIGDMYVVMTILCLQLGIRIDDCVYRAYDEIKDRKGQMVNGVFVKESDLQEDND